MIITLTGINDFLRSQALSELTKLFIEENGDISLERYEGDQLEPQQLPSILQAQPFLSTKRMVVLSSPSAQKDIQESLENLLSTVSDSTDLIIVEPKLDKRTTYYKALQKQTDFRLFAALSENQLTNWLISQAKVGKGSVSPADARFLINRVGTNQQLLNSELQKLLDYQPTVDRHSVQVMTEPTPQSSTFDLLDAALNGQSQRLVSLYHDQRQQKVEPLVILGLLGWQLHILALIKTAGQRSAPEIAQQAGVNPFVVQKSQAIARRVAFSTIKSWVERATQLDVKLKSQPIDADQALLHFLLTIS